MLLCFAAARAPFQFRPPKWLFLEVSIACDVPDFRTVVNACSFRGYLQRSLPKLGRCSTGVVPTSPRLCRKGSRGSCLQTSGLTFASRRQRLSKRDHAALTTPAEARATVSKALRRSAPRRPHIKEAGEKSKEEAFGPQTAVWRRRQDTVSQAWEVVPEVQSAA